MIGVYQEGRVGSSGVFRNGLHIANSGTLAVTQGAQTLSGAGSNVAVDADQRFGVYAAGRTANGYGVFQEIYSRPGVFQPAQQGGDLLSARGTVYVAGTFLWLMPMPSLDADGDLETQCTLNVTQGGDTLSARGLDTGDAVAVFIQGANTLQASGVVHPLGVVAVWTPVTDAADTWTAVTPASSTWSDA